MHWTRKIRRAGGLAGYIILQTIVKITMPEPTQAKSEAFRFPGWLLPVLSWAVSLYFFVDLVRDTGFLPTEATLNQHAPVLTLFLFFLFLPFFSKIKIGKLLEIEREVEKAKEDLEGFKAEVRNNLSVISTSVNTISGFSNQLTVNLPNTKEIREAREEIENNSPKSLTKGDKQDDLEQLLQREDPTLALAWTRIEIERLVRKILGKRTAASPDELAAMKFATLPRLFNQLTTLYPRYQYLNDAFRYVMQICNAAIHAQSISYDQALEAAGLGGQIILILKGLANDQE
jgi:hypothetical protein